MIESTTGAPSLRRSMSQGGRGMALALLLRAGETAFADRSTPGPPIFQLAPASLLAGGPMSGALREERCDQALALLPPPTATVPPPPAVTPSTTRLPAAPRPHETGDVRGRGKPTWHRSRLRDRSMDALCAFHYALVWPLRHLGSQSHDRMSVCPPISPFESNRWR
jgi:hypothetical protein